MADRPYTRAEVVARALASAASASRLYPPTSDIPGQTNRRFVETVADLTAEGPVRLQVEPKAFKSGDVVFGEGHPQLAGLAETLYAHQAGQVIFAPGITEEETAAFVDCVTADPAAVREEGGLRTVIISAGVEHIAVVELTLRTSTEEGLLGLDLTAAPMDVIGAEVVKAASEWAKTGADGKGRDDLLESIARLEPAAREMAESRVAEALHLLDEKTRGAVLAAALRQDATGKPMEGMLEVVARMKPAALARLLTLAAARSGGEAATLVPKLELPPEALHALTLMLRPSPRTEEECGVPPNTDAQQITEDALTEDEHEEQVLREQIQASSPQSAATRALSTTLALVGDKPSAESIEAIGDALAPALSAGAFRHVREALELLDRLGEAEGFEVPVSRARQAVAHGDALADGLARLTDPGRVADAATVVAHAGAAGPDVLVEAWLTADRASRAPLEGVMRAVPDLVLAIVGRRARSDPPESATELVALLGRMGDRRAVPALAYALEHLDAAVRSAALSALASYGTPEAWTAVASSLRHPDPATAMRALSVIRTSTASGVTPALIATLNAPRGNRSWEFRRELIECLGQIGSPEAVPVLRREARRAFVFGHGRRMVRQAARDALTAIARGQDS